MTDSLVIKDTVLDIDMGNSRIKWRLSKNGQQVSAGNCFYSDNWQHLMVSGMTAVARIRIASVAGVERTELIVSHCRSYWQLEPELAVARRHCEKVVNGYREPSALGVDRWLALIAAYEKLHRACLIVDCGSAVTLDIVDNEGYHQGGYIVPGIHLMRKVLFQDTDAVKVSGGAQNVSVGPADNTVDAVNRGLLLMVVGFVTESHRQLIDTLGGPVDVIVAGGDADKVSALLPIDTYLYPDLVLDGLALALP